MPSTSRPIPGEKGPHYVYERLAVERSIAALGQALPDFVLLYSMKANPFRPMLEHMRGRGLGIDAASAGEVQLALDVGFAPTDIFFSCPARQRRTLPLPWAVPRWLPTPSAPFLSTNDNAFVILTEGDWALVEATNRFDGVSTGLFSRRGWVRKDELIY